MHGYGMKYGVTCGCRIGISSVIASFVVPLYPGERFVEWACDWTTCALFATQKCETHESFHILLPLGLSNHHSCCTSLELVSDWRMTQGFWV
jgi:hypothetical protein